MKILSVYDKEFAAYGHVITGYDLTELLETLDRISPLPAGTEYVPSNEVLEALPVAKLFAVNEYGGMPIQLGWCNGHNTKLNCLEYHRDSEVNLGTKDFILLLFARPAYRWRFFQRLSTMLPAALQRVRASRCLSFCRVERTGRNRKWHLLTRKTNCSGHAISGCWHTRRVKKPQTEPLPLLPASTLI